ncbi:MAG: hypothetical protein QMD09_07390 [Desulfatibacillaceae bacterium]|nr:hypothetical protein [Desulfatibacillaceae bacterium]
MEPLDDTLLKSEIDAIMDRVSGVMKRLKERGLSGEEQHGADSAKPQEPENDRQMESTP